MANKFKAKGLIFKFGATNPPTATVAQVGDGTLNFGDREAAIDVTDHNTVGNTTEKLDNGWKEPFSFDGELHWDPDDATHEALRAALESGASNYAQYIIPNTGQAAVTGICRVKSLSAPLPVKGKLALNISIEGMAAGSFAQ